MFFTSQMSESDLLSIDSIDNEAERFVLVTSAAAVITIFFYFTVLNQHKEKKDEGHSFLFVLLFDDVCSVYLHGTSYNVSGT